MLLGQAPATLQHLKPPRPQTLPPWIRPGTIMTCVLNPLPLPFLTMCSLPKFCYICLNGGQLHLCDHCPMAVCYDCLPLPSNLDISPLDFLCPTCHEGIFKAQAHMPYYVCASLHSLPNCSSPLHFTCRGTMFQPDKLCLVLPQLGFKPVQKPQLDHSVAFTWLWL